MYNNFNKRNGSRCGANNQCSSSTPYVPPQQYPVAAASDYGPNPFVVDISKAASHNNAFRTAMWTGKHSQLILMSIAIGEDIGMEVHPNVDQILCIVEGQGLAMMGSGKDDLYIRQFVFEDSMIFVPAGTWHNVVNTGNRPLKLYAVYSPPSHPWGALHQTKTDAEAAEMNTY